MTGPAPHRRIGALLVNWNTAALTADCVQSLRASTRPVDTILVVDNGSDPADAARVADLGVNLLRLPENTGFTGGNNAGIRQLLHDGADLVWILNNDTLVDADCLAALESHLDAHPDAGAVSAKIYFADPPRRLWYAGGILPWASLSSRHRGIFEDDTGRYDTPGETDFLCGCCMLVRADVLRRIGGFHPDYFAYFEDTEWSLRARRAGVRLAYEPRARMWHRIGASMRNRDDNACVGGRAECLIFRNWVFTIRLHAHGLQRIVAAAAVLRHAARQYIRALALRRPAGATAILGAIRAGMTHPLRTPGINA